MDDRLPASLYIDAHLHDLTARGIPYYIIQKGAPSSGTILLKLYSAGESLLYQQQRDLDGEMGWMALFGGARVAEREADEYIGRAVRRDPDLWVIEIEDREMKNPFEGKVF